ncbi:hypothetical protein [Myceligenerans pegani]|uniref:Uncharacterized protein n=1 Tax=Myceligenerans pegani TaxID=2776917 RepID=A0ABR9MYY0_9MICO|nr:hypothetical protein [Myceligenerans sp. TRM 65318]MBE1876597.1 hypothetical protein [Myceligenerans sp. TRM 65318]MBE3018868.1 hypothetical protein [Myceligenerans sp. TRM 65318]
MTGDTYNISGKNVVGVAKDHATVHIGDGTDSKVMAAFAEVVTQIREVRSLVHDDADAGTALDEALPILENAGPTQTPKVTRALNRIKEIAVALGAVGAALLDAVNNVLQLLGVL